ncbi:hypothetical protein QO002_005784 [Pararhizobium capsulatum DSM 1112]|uniref:Uncharacterized protein n=1 Tax=Pararhizobium capsulatum DSM 1112 TaxID=1121113 RepID=A0ABU0BZ91_9HYPH|nr:hypothetical protein [Pararhizobium capsulatum DSM 1112]
MNLYETSIPPKDIFLLQSVLDVWCKENHVNRKDASEEAKILISEYKNGTRSQIKLMDALFRRH